MTLPSQTSKIMMKVTSNPSYQFYLITLMTHSNNSSMRKKNFLAISMFRFSTKPSFQKIQFKKCSSDSRTKKFIMKEEEWTIRSMICIYLPWKAAENKSSHYMVTRHALNTGCYWIKAHKEEQLMHNLMHKLK